jgi:conjugative transfer pilus assembly protein TraH
MIHSKMKDITMKYNMYNIFVKVFICWISFASLTNASMKDQLVKYFNRVGGATNVTNPASYNNQNAGYYNGGSFYGRVPVYSTQFMNVQMPGFRMGCGGIDAWAGGFSHIGSQELIKALRSIGANMGTYAFMLAIESLSPEIYNIMNELNNLAQQVNALGVNSCETAAAALGGLLPRSDATAKHLCAGMGSSGGMLRDYASSRQGCGAGGERNAILDSNPNRVVLKDQFNVAWEAIRKNTFLADNTKLAEMFMSLAGTIVVRRSQGASDIQNDQPMEVERIPSLATKETFTKAMLEGGPINLYSCGSDPDRCLRPTENKGGGNVGPHEALIKKVSDLLNGMVNKIYEDDVNGGGLSPEEIGLLNSTTLPVYKMINVLTAYKRGYSPLEVETYAHLIAMDILNHFVIEVIDLVTESMHHLRKAQVNDDVIREYLGSLASVRSTIMQQRESAIKHMDATLSFIKSVQVVEKQLHIMLGSVANEYNSL